MNPEKKKKRESTVWNHNHCQNLISLLLVFQRTDNWRPKPPVTPASNPFPWKQRVTHKWSDCSQVACPQHNMLLFPLRTYLNGLSCQFSSKWEAYNNKMEVVCVWAGGVRALHFHPVTLHPADFNFMDQPAKWEHPWNQIHFGILLKLSVPKIFYVIPRIGAWGQQTQMSLL